jgi:DNA-binding MarR family transcriptional regulator
MELPHEKDRETIRGHIRALAADSFGVADTSGIELFSLIRAMAHLSEALECSRCEGETLSSTRWRLMMSLVAEEFRGNLDGITPTDLSRYQRVSKNTISSLLRGLEEQGLIRRNLDPDDYRIFRIQLTPTGRELIHATAPDRIRRLNEMAAVLSAEERDQLMALLEKLMHSLVVSHKPRLTESL